MVMVVRASSTSSLTRFWFANAVRQGKVWDGVEPVLTVVLVVRMSSTSSLTRFWFYECAKAGKGLGRGGTRPYRVYEGKEEFHLVPNSVLVCERGKAGESLGRGETRPYRGYGGKGEFHLVPSSVLVCERGKAGKVWDGVEPVLTELKKKRAARLSGSCEKNKRAITRFYGAA